MDKLIRIEGRDGNALYLNPREVRGLTAVSWGECLTVVLYRGAPEERLLAKGTPDEVAAALGLTGKEGGQ